MDKSLKELKNDKFELQRRIESLVNEFRSKYDNPQLDIFTIEVSELSQLKIDIDVKF